MEQCLSHRRHTHKIIFPFLFFPQGMNTSISKLHFDLYLFPSQGNRILSKSTRISGKENFATRLECNSLILFFKCIKINLRQVEFIPNLGIRRKLASFQAIGHVNSALATVLKAQADARTKLIRVGTRQQNPINHGL